MVLIGCTGEGIYTEEVMAMAKKKVGDLIKEARTGAGMTQEALARKVKGVSAQDISKAERGELALTQAQLKEIAKATGVTQKSLLDAAAGSSSGTSAKKPASGAKKPSTAKKPAASTSSMKVTSTEKRLVELYRKADADSKKAAVAILRGKKQDTGNVLSSILLDPAFMDNITGFFGREMPED